MLQPKLMALVVNGESVDDAEVREEIRSLRPRYYDAMAGRGDRIALETQLRDWSRENVVERVLLRQEAVRRGITTEALIASISSKVSPPRYKDVGEFYKKNKESLVMPAVVRVSHIVKNVDENVSEEQALDRIRQAEAELQAGADFADVASRYSDCPGDGVDLGWIPPGQLVGQFDDTIFNMKAGETSGIFRTLFGFHIAKVFGRREPGIPGLMDVREQIEEVLRKQKVEKAMEQFVDRLKAVARIEG